MDLMTAAPKLTGDVQKDIKNLTDHIFQLEEYLRYQLRNLDVTNFNDLGLARYENGRLQFYAEAVEVHTKDLEVRLENTEKTVSSLDETAVGLQSEVATIKATSEEIRTEVSAVETNLGKQIGGLQDQQLEDYLYLDGKIDTKVTELNSTISQTAKEIRSEVSASLKSVNGEIENVRSSITQTAGEIRLEVSTVSVDLETLSGEVTKIDGRQDALYEVYKDEQELNYNRYEALSSEIVQNQNRIALVVKKENGSNVVDAASIVAAINDAGSEVKIAADHVKVDASSIDLTGVVKITDLQEGGSVKVWAGNIQAGGTVKGVRLLSALNDSDKTNYTYVDRGYLTNNTDQGTITLGDTYINIKDKRNGPTTYYLTCENGEFGIETNQNFLKMSSTTGGFRIEAPNGDCFDFTNEGIQWFGYDGTYFGTAQFR